MAWDSEMVLIVRELIHDVGSPPAYSDTRIKSMIVVAAQLLNVNTTWMKQYQFTIETPAISPDPTVSPRDEAFISLVALKAACNMAQGEFRTASRQAIVIQDGNSRIELRGISDAKSKLMNQLIDVFDKAMLEYKTSGIVYPIGRAIIGPSTISQYSNERIL